METNKMYSFKFDVLHICITDGLYVNTDRHFVTRKHIAPIVLMFFIFIISLFYRFE